MESDLFCQFKISHLLGIKCKINDAILVFMSAIV